MLFPAGGAVQAAAVGIDVLFAVVSALYYRKGLYNLLQTNRTNKYCKLITYMK